MLALIIIMESDDSSLFFDSSISKSKSQGRQFKSLSITYLLNTSLVRKMLDAIHHKSIFSLLRRFDFHTFLLIGSSMDWGRLSKMG